MEGLEHIPDRPLTYDDWLGLPETNLPVDVVDGVLIMSPAPTGLHQLVLENLFAVFLETVPSGYRPAVAPRDWVLWDVPLLVRQPDLMIVTAAQARESQITERPLLAIEVLSPTSRERDLVTKPAEYAKAGLAHLWLVDPDIPEVVARRWDGNEWIEVARATADEVLMVKDPVVVSLRPADLVA